MVEMTGFEPAASASRTQRSTKLSHISILIKFYGCFKCAFYLFALLLRLTLAVPKIFYGLERLKILTAVPFESSLYLPQAAVAFKTTKLSHISIDVYTKLAYLLYKNQFKKST